MRIIAHISDLHFGAVRLEVAEALLSALIDASPDLVAVSGDLTQRARPDQFVEAAGYLDRIPFPKLIVPGNHDIPLFNVLKRTLFPLAEYRRHIARETSPQFIDDEIAGLGINTARSLAWKNGRVSREQMWLIRDRFCSVPKSLWKVLVTHHPFLAPPGDSGEAVVGRAEEMFLKVEGCSPDLALAGHYHMSYAGGTHAVNTGAMGSTLVIQAGTAISVRTRREKNSFNLITLDSGNVLLSIRMWDNGKFVEKRNRGFSKKDGAWVEH